MRLVAVLVVGVVILAIALRVGLVASLIANDRAELMTGSNDTRQYKKLAHTIATTGSYHGENPPISTINRTPGFPLYLAVFEYYNMPDWIAVLVQGVIAGLAVGVVFLLVNDLVQQPWLAAGASLLAAISPTAISLSGLMLTDSLAASVFLFGFYLLFLGIQRQSLVITSLASLTFCGAAFIRPVLFYWCPAAVLVWVCFAWAVAQSIQWRHVLAFTLIQVVLLGSWVVNNQRVHGIAKFSTVGDASVVSYLGAKTRVIAAGEYHWEKLRPMQAKTRAMVQEKVNEGMTWHQAVQYVLAETLEFFQQHPTATVHAYFHNIDEQLHASMSSLRPQFPQDNLGLEIELLDKRYRYLLYWFGLLSLAVTALEWGVTRSENSTRRFFGGLAVAITLGFFIAFAGFTFSVGSRILHPADFCVITLSALGLMTLPWLWRAGRGTTLDLLHLVRRRLLHATQ